MLKRLFQFSNEPDRHHQDALRNGSSGQGLAVIELETVECNSTSQGTSGSSPRENPGKAKATTFEQIYQNAAVKPLHIPYSILKVSDMMNSPHLSGMSPDARRCALLMALEAAGAKVEDLLQDAMVRQRALSDYEDSLQDQLQKFETAKAEENRLIQAELDRLTKQYMSRIQANLDEVAGEQDELRTWQERKQKESERMTEAASYCVPQGNSTNGLGLAAMLERVDSHRR